MAKWLNTFTGAEIARKVDEYTEVVGTILLGLHADTQKQQKQMDAHSQSIQTLQSLQQEQADALQRLQHDLQTLRSTWQAQQYPHNEVDALQQLQKQMDAYESIVLRLRWQCALAYLFTLIMGLILWIVK